VTEADALANWPRHVLAILLGTTFALVSVVLLSRRLTGQIHHLRRSGSTLARKHTELEIAHRQLDAALSNIPLGICFASGDNKLILCNQKYRAIYNLPPEATRPGITTIEVMDYLFTSDRRPRVGREQYITLRDGMIGGGTRRQMIVELISGHSIAITHQPMPDGGWIATHEDITDRRRADSHIRYLAHHDILTGLLNRAAFTEKLDDAVTRLHRHGACFAVFLIDLDRFKTVNDTLGHLAGDQLLREAGSRLKSLLTETDNLARLGGDEFAILLSAQGSPREDSASLAARILTLMSEPFDIDGNPICVGASVGIALASEPTIQSYEILRMADLALYDVKENGRNHSCFYEAGMLSALRERRDLEHQLRLAISAEEFELHYQALIDVNTGQQKGFEALVRWPRSSGECMTPDNFIPLAEETGLIVPLGKWILRRACADAVNWPSHIKVAVNLSPVQLAHQELFQHIQGALDESSLPPERLELEITETALLRYNEDCETLIRKLKTLGISIALDDFGTGYSSLSYLTMIPFDTIKIDRSFTMKMTERADCAAIVAAVVALGHNLNTQTVAEGVETLEDLAILRAAGVTLVQGYLFSKPCPASDLILDDIPNAHLFASAA